MTIFATVHPGTLFWLLALVHIVGLASMFLARMPRPVRRQLVCHYGFVACLVFVAAATLFTIVTRSDWWVWSGTTFSIMAVGATVDLEQASAASRL